MTSRENEVFRPSLSSVTKKPNFFGMEVPNNTLHKNWTSFVKESLSMLITGQLFLLKTNLIIIKILAKLFILNLIFQPNEITNNAWLRRKRWKCYHDKSSIKHETLSYKFWKRSHNNFWFFRMKVRKTKRKT